MGDFQRNRHGNRFGGERLAHVVAGTQPVGKQHAAHNPHHAAHQLRGGNRQPLAADARPLLIHGDGQTHDGRLQPKSDHAAGLHEIVVADAEEFQVADDQNRAHHQRVGQRAAAAQAQKQAEAVNGEHHQNQYNGIGGDFPHLCLLKISCVFALESSTSTLLATVAAAIDQKSCATMEK